jgi:phage baseplate assembly protein gpV
VEPAPERRALLVHKALRSLDRYLGPHPRDGGCDEGPAYWGRAGASLFESLELLQSASSGRIDVFADPVIREIGRFIYRVRIAGDWFVNIGDAGARVRIDGGLAYRYGTAIGDPLLQALGASGATEEDVALDDRSIGRALFSLFGWEARAAKRALPTPLVRDAWLPSEDLQMMTARDGEGSAAGFFVAAWGGHNNQSHNHNDVGNAIVFADGEPVLIDAGRPTYTSQTFSGRRYEIWAMQSAYHNLPTVNGVMQAATREAAAKDVSYTVSAEAAELRMDIAPAYPASAGIASWVRAVRLNRGRQVVISDRFALTRATSAVALHLMTPCEAAEASPGVLRLTCGRIGKRAPLTLLAAFDAAALGARVEPIALDDASLVQSWGDHLNRITLTARAPVQNGAWTLTLTRQGRQP